MKTLLLTALVLAASLLRAQDIRRDVRYLDDGHARHVLDIYQPKDAKNLPVVF